MTLIEVLMIAGFLAGGVTGACFGQKFGNIAATLGAIVGAALGLGVAALFENLLFRLADLCSPKTRGYTKEDRKDQNSQQPNACD